MRLRPGYIPSLTVLVAGVCPLLSGCVSVGWAYPTASFIPAISVAAAPQDVRAFRIDLRDDHFSHAQQRPDLFDEAEEDSYEMSEITMRLGDRLFPQGKLAFDYGWQSTASASEAQPFVRGRETDHLLLVRLYRSGYKTVEVESWQLAANPNWQEAKTLLARERAIDDLVSTFARDARAHAEEYLKRGGKDGGARTEPPRDSSVFARMAPGSVSDAHRAALIFAASEYDLLARAGSDGTDREVIARVTQKAADLHKLAAR